MDADGSMGSAAPCPTLDVAPVALCGGHHCAGLVSTAQGGPTGTRWSLWPQHPLTTLGWVADAAGHGAPAQPGARVWPASMLRSPVCHRCWRTSTRPQPFLQQRVAPRARQAPSAGSPRTSAECRGSVDPASRSGVTMWAAAPRRALLLLASVHATTSPPTHAADITNRSPTLLQAPGVAHSWPTGQSGDPGDPKGEWDSCPGKVRAQHAASWHLCLGTDRSLTGVLSPRHAALWAGCSVSTHGL